MKKVVVGLALCVAIFASWYFLSPRWTLWRMAAAAEANDAERLSTYIDFLAVRDSMKQELKAQLAAKLVGETDGMKGIGGLLGMGMVDSMVDAMVTPAMMRNAFAKNKSVPAAGQSGLRLDAEGTELIRDSLDQFRLHRGGKPDLVFGWRGLGWKFVAIRLDGSGSTVRAAFPDPA